MAFLGSIGSAIAEGASAIGSGLSSAARTAGELTGLVPRTTASLAAELPDVPTTVLGASKTAANTVEAGAETGATTTEKVFNGINTGIGLAGLGYGIYKDIDAGLHPPHAPKEPVMSSHPGGAVGRQTQVNAAGLSANGGGAPGQGPLQYAT